MARRSSTSILKRQRELKKSEKAARKRAKRHGLQIEPRAEPTPTVSLSDLAARDDGDQEPDSNDDVAQTDDAGEEPAAHG